MPIAGAGDPAARPITGKPVQNPRSAHLAGQFESAVAKAKQDQPAQPVKRDTQPTRQDLQKDPDGQIEYTVQPRDSLATIGKKFGRSEKELKASNPKFFRPYADPNRIKIGQKLTILNDDRATIAVQMMKTKDPQKLKELVAKDLSYATRSLATPTDGLAAAQNSIIARRPDDTKFAELVKQQGATLTEGWKSQGRSHEVWDPILQHAEKGDCQGVKTVIGDEISVLAATEPTVDAVKDGRKRRRRAGRRRKDPRELQQRMHSISPPNWPRHGPPGRDRFQSRERQPKPICAVIGRSMPEYPQAYEDCPRDRIVSQAR